MLNIARRPMIVVLLTVTATWLSGSVALAQSGDAVPSVAINSWSRFPFLGQNGFGGQVYGPEEALDPINVGALELDIVVAHLTVIDTDWMPLDPNNPATTTTGQDVYLSFSALPLVVNGYPSPPAPPILGSSDLFAIKITPPPGATSVDYDLVMKIPRINEANQARLRGYIPIDVAWDVRLRVSNDQSGSDPTRVRQIDFFYLGASKSPNLAPPNPQALANAGSDQTVAKSTPVTLDASRTFESFNIGFDSASPNVFLKDNLTYIWQWISGPTQVDPVQPDQHSPTATVTLDVSGVYVFRVTVDDNASAEDPTQDSVTITVVDSLPVNNPPTAVIVGPAGRIPVGAILKLDGSQSFDPENNSLKYRWKQINQVGGDLTPADLAKIFQPLSGVDQAVTTWQAVAPGTFYFRLNVSDSEFLSTTTFTIVVFDPNDTTATSGTASSTDTAGDPAADSANTAPTTDSTDGKAGGLLSGAALCGSGLTFALLPAMLWMGSRRRRS